MAYLLKNLNNRVLNLQPYNYTTHKPDYYAFTSAIGCEYDCYFYDFSSAFYLYPDLAPKVFGFNLELKFKPEGLDKIPLDKQIAATVTSIIKAFINKKENVVVYICDNKR